MNLSRRRMLALAAGAASLAHFPAGASQPRYPNGPVRMIVPGTVGGGSDIVARLLSVRLAEALGGSVVVETVPGAGGQIGTSRVVKAAADGQTLLFAFNQLLTMNPHLMVNLPYDVERDFVPVSLLTETAYVWIANKQLAVNSIPELVAAAKRDPGGIAIGVNGMGSAARLGAEMLRKVSGAELLITNYSGNATPDLLSGVIQLKMEPYAVAVGLVKGGLVKALAVTGRERLAALPDVPAMQEHFPGYIIPASYSVWAPQGTPSPVLDLLSAALTKVLKDPEIHQRLEGMSQRVVGGSPGELQAYTAAESRMWGQLIKDRNIERLQ